MKRLAFVFCILVCAFSVVGVFGACGEVNYVTFTTPAAEDTKIPLNSYKTIDSLVRGQMQSSKMKVVMHFSVTSKTTDLSYDQVSFSCPDYDCEKPGYYIITAVYTWPSGEKRSATLTITLLDEVEVTDFSAKHPTVYFSQYSSQTMGINLSPLNASFQDMEFSFDQGNENKLAVEYNKVTYYYIYADVSTSGPGLTLTRLEAVAGDIIQVTATLTKGAKAATSFTFTVNMLS